VQLGERLAALDAADPRERAREGIRQVVRFATAHLDLFRPMVDPGESDDRRTAWRVERHAKPPHDARVGAASVPSAVAPEARRLAGLDPSDPDAVEAHADFVARRLVPDEAETAPG